MPNGGGFLKLLKTFLVISAILRVQAQSPGRSTSDPSKCFSLRTSTVCPEFGGTFYTQKTYITEYVLHYYPIVPCLTPLSSICWWTRVFLCIVTQWHHKQYAFSSYSSRASYVTTQSIILELATVVTPQQCTILLHGWIVVVLWCRFGWMQGAQPWFLDAAWLLLQTIVDWMTIGIILCSYYISHALGWAIWWVHQPPEHRMLFYCFEHSMRNTQFLSVKQRYYCIWMIIDDFSNA